MLNLNDDSRLKSIVCVSTSRVSLENRKGVESLIGDADFFYRTCGVASVLIVDQRSLFKYLEGNASGVEEVYARISKNRCHSGLIKLLDCAISRRVLVRPGLNVLHAQAVSVSSSQPEKTRFAELVRPGASYCPGDGFLLLAEYWNRVRIKAVISA